jgi:cob(I)alamin adenosyltransferase
MKKNEIKKEIENIDQELFNIDETLSSSDEISVHELFQKEAKLLEKKFLLIQEYEQLIAY